MTVTADALDTVKATAELIYQRGGQFVFAVKEDRRALFDALDVLPWTDVPIAYSRVDKGHGRIARRTIQVLPAPPDLPFPHVNQVWLRNLAINALRLAGRHDITEATRWASRQMTRPFAILELIQ